jgi:hypothetical protein
LGTGHHSSGRGSGMFVTGFPVGHSQNATAFFLQNQEITGGHQSCSTWAQARPEQLDASVVDRKEQQWRRVHSITIRSKSP